MQPSDLGDQPLPERQGLGVRVGHPKQRDPLIDPAQHPCAQFKPEPGDRVRSIEINVDAVRIFSRRVLGITDRAVGAPVEPARVLREPGVVWGALHGEVQGNFKPLSRSGRDHAAKIIPRTPLRVNRRLPALLAAIGRRAARFIRTCLQRIVRPCGVVLINAMNGRQNHHVKTHVVNHGQAGMHIIERAVTGRVIGD